MSSPRWRWRLAELLLAPAWAWEAGVLWLLGFGKHVSRTPIDDDLD